MHVVELEAKLAADVSGSLREKICMSLADERAGLRRIIDGGLPPEEFKSSKPITTRVRPPNGSSPDAGVIRVWDADAHKLVAELLSHTDRVLVLAWSADGSLLFGRMGHFGAKFGWPPQTDPVMLLNSHADQVHTLAFSPDGKYLACADSDFDIHLWTDPERAVEAPLPAATRTRFARSHSAQMGPSLPVPALPGLSCGRRYGATWARHGRQPPSARASAIQGQPRGRHGLAADERSTTATRSCPAFGVAASPNGHWLAIGKRLTTSPGSDARAGVLAATLEATKPPV